MTDYREGLLIGFIGGFGLALVIFMFRLIEVM